jgi:hypothetical protein
VLVLLDHGSGVREFLAEADLNSPALGQAEPQMRDPDVAATLRADL